MEIILSQAATVLALCLCAGLVRIFLGPSIEDRMLAVQLMGTVGVALLLVLATRLNFSAGIDIALVFAMLATVSVVALTRRPLSKENPND